MHIYDDQFARNPARRSAFGDRAQARARANAPVGSGPLDESTVLNLQRLAGNSAVAELLADGGDPQRQSRKDEEVGAPQPRLSLGTFASDATSRSFGALPDKSATEKEEETDQHVDVGTFTPLTRGLKIIAEVSGGFESTDWPDGFKFT